MLIFFSIEIYRLGFKSQEKKPRLMTGLLLIGLPF